MHLGGHTSEYPMSEEARGEELFSKVRNSLLSFVEHRLPLFVCALLVLDYVLAWGRQYLRAWEIASMNEREFKTLSYTFIHSK